jgi:hypothetical protein
VVLRWWWAAAASPALKRNGTEDASLEVIWKDYMIESEELTGVVGTGWTEDGPALTVDEILIDKNFHGTNRPISIDKAQMDSRTVQQRNTHLDEVAIDLNML